MERRLTTGDVCALYSGITPKTLCSWKKKYAMPFIKIGRECFFIESDLMAWERAHAVPHPLVLHRSRPKSILSLGEKLSSVQPVRRTVNA